MKRFLLFGTFDSTFSWITNIGLVIKNVVNTVHHQVVGNQEIERTDPEHHIE